MKSIPYSEATLFVDSKHQLDILRWLYLEMIRHHVIPTQMKAWPINKILKILPPLLRNNSTLISAYEVSSSCPELLKPRVLRI